MMFSKRQDTRWGIFQILENFRELMDGVMCYTAYLWIEGWRTEMPSNNCITKMKEALGDGSL